MATTVTYKGQVLVTVDNSTNVLETSGTWCEDDFTLVDTGSGGGVDTLGQALTDTLITYSNSNITTLPDTHAFAFVTSLETLSLPNLESANEYMIRQTAIKYAVFPKYEHNLGWRVFSYVSTLLAVDIIGSTSGLSNECFRNDTNLTTLILRGNRLTALANTGAFAGTPFASGGSGGVVYVPSAMISSYQNANNWSTILWQTNNSIQAIEGSQYENYYADGTPIS